MISGQQAFGGMSTTLARERTALDGMEMQLRELRSQIEDLHQQDLEDMRSLARLRLDDVMAGDIIGRLSRAEASAKKLLEQRDASHSALDQQITDANALLERFHADREERQRALEQSETEIAQAEDQTRNRLLADTEYSKQAEATRAADVRAANAQQKADQSEAELTEKGQAYNDNRLFKYLWDRNYGMPGYRAFPLFRFLDGWVAGLIDYSDARLNYSRLTESPVRLSEHAQKLALLSDAEDEKLAKLWNAARLQDGIDALDAELDRAQESIAAINEEIEKTQDTLEEMQAERHSKTDAATRKATDVLTKAYRRKDIDDLWDDAHETLREDDDRIVNRMIAREEERDRLEDLLEDINDRFDSRHHRLEDFGGMLRQFERKYTKKTSGFLDGAMIGILVKEFLEGILDVDDWWEGVERQHRRRRDGSTARSGPWGGKKRKRRQWPTGGRKSGSIFGSGGGGFRTGGGFRSSGGFRTGGGV